MRMKRVIAGIIAGVALIGAGAGCASKRQIDVDETHSFKIEGTSWYGMCQGGNAFIWVPGKTDTDPDELEAVIYDDYRCVKDVNPSAPAASQPTARPDSDPDGIVDDED